MRTLGSYDLFLQYCIMTAFICTQHATVVNDELGEAVHGLDKKAKKHLLRAMAKAMKDMTALQDEPPQRVDEPPTSEGVP